MIASNPIWEIWTADFWTLMVFPIIFIPFALAYAAFDWLRDKWSNR